MANEIILVNALGDRQLVDLDGETSILVTDAAGERKLVTATPGGGGGGTWGSITGTLSAQTDLQSALDAKATLNSVARVMTTVAFDAETTVGTLNPSGRTAVKLSDSPYDCMWNGASWDYYYKGTKATRPASAGWTKVVAGAAAQADQLTLGFSKAVMHLSAPVNAQSQTYFLAVRPVSGNFTLSACVAPGFTATGLGVGIAAYASGSGNFVVFYRGFDGTGAAVLNVYNYTAGTPPTPATAVSLSSFVMAIGPDMDMQMTDDGVNRIMSYRNWGSSASYVPLYSVARTTFITPTHVGVFVRTGSSTVVSEHMVASFSLT